MYEDYTEEDNEKLSKFNSAKLINMRLHNLWLDCTNHSRKGKFLGWNADLDRVWCELAADEEEGNDNFKRFDKFNDELRAINPIMNWKSSEGFSDAESPDPEKKNKQYKKLMDKEIFLRTLMHKQGKGTAYQDDASHYMDG